MRSIKTTTISILAVGLLAGSAVGVAAQDEEVADPIAHAIVTGSISGTRTSSGSATAESGAVLTEGVGFQQTWEASDPRLSGSVSYAGNWLRYPGTGELQVEASSVVLDNADGRWRGIGTGMVAGDLSMETTILRGEGGYEGLTAYVMQDWAQGLPAAFTAAIFPGEMPVSPEPPSAE